MNRRADVTAGLVVALATLMSVQSAVRLRYDDAVRVLAHEADRRAAEDLPGAARWAVAARNQAKIDARRWDLEVVRLREEDRNRARYGDPVGPTYEQLRATSTDAEVIASAGRTNGRRDSAAILSASVAPGIAILAGLARGFQGDARDTMRAWLVGPIAWFAARGCGVVALALTSPFARSTQESAAFLAVFVGIALGIVGARRLVPEPTA